MSISEWDLAVLGEWALEVLGEWDSMILFGIHGHSDRDFLSEWDGASVILSGVHPSVWVVSGVRLLEWVWAVSGDRRSEWAWVDFGGQTWVGECQSMEADRFSLETLPSFFPEVSLVTGG